MSVALPVTVPQPLHDRMADAISAEFAASYLSGAKMVDGALRPRTYFAHDALAKSPAARLVLKGLGVSLGQPLKPHERVAA